MVNQPISACVVWTRCICRIGQTMGAGVHFIQGFSGDWIFCLLVNYRLSNRVPDCNHSRHNHFWDEKIGGGKNHDFDYCHSRDTVRQVWWSEPSPCRGLSLLLFTNYLCLLHEHALLWMDTYNRCSRNASTESDLFVEPILKVRIER